MYGWTKTISKYTNSKKQKLTKNDLLYKDLYLWILAVIPDCIKPTTYTLKTKCYWIINSIRSFNDKRVRCANKKCKKPFKNRNIKNIFAGYSSRGLKYTYCCQKCAASADLTKLNSQKTCIKKYKVKFSFQSKNNKEKTKKYMIKMYGVEFYVQTPEFKQKSELTKELKHGYKYWNNRAKAQKTCIKLFKKSHPMKNKKICKAASLTYFKRTGYYHPAQNPEVQKCTHSSYKYANIFFKSKSELAYFIWLIDNNYIFEYQPSSKCIKYYDKKHHKHIYHPDFWIISHNNKIINEIHEIKGDNQFKDYDITKTMIHLTDPSLNYIAEAKHKCMLKHNVKILTTKDYLVFEKYVIAKYGKHYLKSFKL